MDPICKVCGVTLSHIFDPPPEYCGRCDPLYPRVNLQALEGLNSVPSVYRQLVTKDHLHDIHTCGDVEYLYANTLSSAREAYEELESCSHLQPFAQTAGGDLWCWTGFRVGVDSEPEIWLFEESLSQIVIYAPSFETFLYRAALEDACGRWAIPADELPSIIQGSADILTDVGSVELANDLRLLSQRPISDQASVEVKGHGVQQLGVISEDEVRDRITQFLGDIYLDSAHPYSILEEA